MFLLKKNNPLPLFLIIFGILLIIFSLGYKIYSKKVLSFSSQPTVVEKSVVNNIIPKKIIIPKVGIDLPIDVSTIKNNTWEVSKKNASYLDLSATLAAGGNTVIYGHNKSSILGAIRQVEKGDEIELLGSDDKSYKYIVDHTVVVDPDNIEYVQPKDRETLTIYTCTGLFDSKRHIIVAYPKPTM